MQRYQKGSRGENMVNLGLVFSSNGGSTLEVSRLLGMPQA